MLATLCDTCFPSVILRVAVVGALAIAVEVVPVVVAVFPSAAKSYS